MRDCYLDETRRQTGRTTALLQRAKDKGVLFITYHEQMKRYCENLMPEMRGKIVTVAEVLRRPILRSTTGSISDHDILAHLLSESWYDDFVRAMKNTNGEIN